MGSGNGRYFSSTALVNMKRTKSDNVRPSLAARCWSFANTLRGMMALTTAEWGSYSVHMLIAAILVVIGANE